MVKTESAAALRLRLVVTEHQEGMGRRMRARREALNLSRDEVARRMGAIAAANDDVDKTNGNAIYRYEIGEVTPGPKKLDLLARALETEVVTFMVDAPKEGTPDLMRALNGEDSQLDRIEKLLQSVTPAATPALRDDPRDARELAAMHARLDDLQEAVDRIEGYLREQASAAVRERVGRAARQQRKRRDTRRADPAAEDG